MGIGFSYGNASWSYSGFNIFRHKLSESININLNEYYGFGGIKLITDIKDDVVPLLNQSDVDGELSVEECKKVAPRLKQIVSEWKDNIENSYDKHQGLLLVEGMELAIKNNKPLIFC